MTLRSLLRAVLLSGILALMGVSALAASVPQNQPIDWKAQFVWPSNSAIPVHDFQFIMFRKTWNLDQVPSNAKLTIFADSRYRVFVNGSYVAQGPARAPHGWHYYDTFDVASKLRPGRNVIAVEVLWYGYGTAWYVSPAYSPGAFFGQKPHGELLCQLDLGAGPNHRVIATDGTWKASVDRAWDWDTPLVDSAVGNVEVYHSDRATPGWTEAQFDDSGWIPVTDSRSIWGLSSPPVEPYTHMAPRPMAYPLEEEMAPARVVDAGVMPASAAGRSPFNRQSPLATLGKRMADEKHTSQPSLLHSADALSQSSPDAYAEIDPAPAGQTPYVILDMGKEVDGYLQFSVDATQPAAINIGWSEMMEHGDVTANMPGGNFVAQYHVQPGSQHWTMWGWHGLRFVELDFPGLTAPLKFRVNLRFSTANLKHAGAFSSSSPLLTKLWQMGSYTFQLCSLDGTMDCPTREQRQWLGDGEVELRVDGVAHGNLDLARKFLRDAALDEWRDGPIPMVSDTGEPPRVLIDDYVFSWVNALNEYYLETGDKDFVLSLYPYLVRAMTWFNQYQQPNGLLGKVPYWVFLDWSNPDKRGTSEILNALYAHTLDTSASLADMAGDQYHAAMFRDESARIHKAFNQLFWNPSLGLYVDAVNQGQQSHRIGQLANADAVMYGFAPADQVSGILAKITDASRVKVGGLDPATNQFSITETSASSGQTIVQAQTYGMFFVLESLAERGDAATMLRYIQQLWGPMVKVGNDTFWENFIQASGTSCHAWSAAPTYFLTTEILGVRPTSPGYADYRVAPHPVDLTWAKGTVPTVHGDINVDWKWSSSDPTSFTMQLHNPAGETAHIVLPDHNGSKPVLVTLNGRKLRGDVVVRQPGDATIEARY